MQRMKTKHFLTPKFLKEYHDKVPPFGFHGLGEVIFIFIIYFVFFNHFNDINSFVIYIEREAKKKNTIYICVCVCVCVYIYRGKMGWVE